MAFKYHVVSISSDICEYDYDEGEGCSTGCGYNNYLIGRTFGTLNDMLKYLASVFGLPEDEYAYDIDIAANQLYTSKAVVDHSEAQNGGWFEPTKEELTAWAQGKMKIYTERFSVCFLRCV